jgi:C4-dicarboxylate-specific signal transduction histidine kinase
MNQERFAGVGVISSGLAHELNNPLQAILGAAALLERESLSLEAKRQIDTIKDQTMRACEIVRSLARFGNLEVGPSSAVRLGSVVSEVLALLAKDLVTPPIVLDVKDESSRSVHANANDLAHVTMNLVRNAQYAIETAHVDVSSGRIEIRIRDVGSQVRLEVSDNGQGVAVNDEVKLFLPFFTTRPVGEGVGLGLAVSYGIVRSYEGTIGYQRNASGGAMFFYELPAVDASVPVESMQPTLAATR